MLHRYSLMFGIWLVLGVLWCAPAAAVTRLDPTFGYNGRLAVELGAKNSGHAVLVQPDGKILVAGSSADTMGGLNFSLLRFHANGTPDTSFDGDGSVRLSLSTGDDEALALGLLADGRILAAGYAHNGRDRDLALVCIRANGTLDPAFGDAGVILTSIGNGNEEITAISVSSANMITVVGSTEGTAGRILVAARYFANGAPDSGFGEEGISLIGVGEDASAEGIIELAGGGYVLAGSYLEKKRSAAMLVGLRDDGTVNEEFGDKGVAVPAGSLAASEGYKAAVDGSGRIYLAGSMGLPGKREAALFRFTADGSADTTFGEHGLAVFAIGKEDDVLYDIDVGKGGVAASGFATDAGVRQFVLIAYTADSYAAGAARVVTAEPDGEGTQSVELASVQEVRITGNTRVQIRRLQVWQNDIRILDLQMLDSLARTLAPLLRTQVPDDLLQAVTGAMASQTPAAATGTTGGVSSSTDQQSTVAPHTVPSAYKVAATPHIVTTTFSEGESVSYALTWDREGSIVTVGTADGGGTSSMVAARFTAEDLVDRITEQPGQRSGHVTTTPPATITKDTITTGGEIAATFGREVVRRGVVFSVNPGPRLTAARSNADSSLPLAKSRSAIDATASFFLPEAQAAQTSNAPAAHGAPASPGAQARETGETANGAGTGGFIAVVDNLLPGTVYYLRAYALTATGEVYYGNQLNVRTADACFIATASFGTLLHPAVTLLRDFRDTCLVSTTFGRRLVDLYYALSPSLAEVVAAHGVLRRTVQMLLLPCVGFSWLALQIGLTGALISLATVALLVWRAAGGQVPPRRNFLQMKILNTSEN